MGSTAQRIFGPAIKASASVYVRERDLPKLMAVWPREIEDESMSGTQHIVDRLNKVAQAYRRLAEDEHWSYDMNLHIAVLSALIAERAKLAQQHLIHLFNEAAE